MNITTNRTNPFFHCVLPFSDRFGLAGVGQTGPDFPHTIFVLRDISPSVHFIVVIFLGGQWEGSIKYLIKVNLDLTFSQKNERNSGRLG